MKFDTEICNGVSCPECSFNKGEGGCLLAERLDDIEIISEPCEDAVSREAVLDMLHQECSSIVENFLKEKINATPSVTAKAEQPEIICCRDCRYMVKARSMESAKKFGQIYECSREVFLSPKPGDFCSYAERRREGGK